MNVFQVLGQAAAQSGPMPAANALLAKAAKEVNLSKPNQQRELAKLAVYSALPALAVGVLGAVLWKKHRVLGFLGGSALGGSVYPMTQGKVDKGVSGLVITGAGIAGSLWWKKHPVLGYVGGNVAATAVTFPLWGHK